MPVMNGFFECGLSIFVLYVLEVNIDKVKLKQAEQKWVLLLKPSYNIGAIMSMKSYLSALKKEKLALQMEKLALQKTENRIKGAHKKAIYCYDWKTDEFVVKFDGIRIASRNLDISTTALSRKIDTDKVQHCTYNNVKHIFLLTSAPKHKRSLGGILPHVKRCL